VCAKDPALSSAASAAPVRVRRCCRRRPSGWRIPDEFRDGIAQHEMSVLDQHHDATETIGFVIEKMRKMLSCAIGAAAAGSAGDRVEPAIWPRRATSTVAPGRVPLSTSRLKASDRRCKRTVESQLFGLACGRRGERADVCRAAVARSWSLPFALVDCGSGEVWRRMPPLNSAFSTRQKWSCQP